MPSRLRSRAPEGKLESFYFGFGAHDAHVIAEMPDNTSAAAAWP